MNEQPPKKKRWKKILIAIWILFVVLILFGPGLVIVSMLATKKVVVKPGTVLEIELNGGIEESSRSDVLSELTGGFSTSIWNVRNALRTASEDEDIVAVLVKIRTVVSGWGAAEEILAQLDRFRESGKPVYTLIETDLVDDMGYFLATGGDHIWVTPEVGVLVNGLASQVSFWRGTLDKLQIQPEIIMYKEYKSAGEPFLNYEMSEYMREALTGVLDTLDARFRERVTARRGIEESDLDTFLNEGMSTSKALLDNKLADRSGYLDEIQTTLQEIKDTEKYQGVSLQDYLRAAELKKPDATDTIAVIFGQGPILTEAPGGGLFGGSQMISGADLAESFRDAVADKDVKAILFRVDSPGGSAVGSDLIRREIRNAREKGKPVVVSMSSVAGSGGYWIAMDADTIVAQPSTITGSIGVVFSKFDLTGFYDLIGAHVDTVATAPYADILGFTPLDEERRAKAEQWVGSVYASFTEHVAEGRKLPLDKVKEIAKGRIWSGSDALGLGLVDKLGGWDEALRIVKEKAGLDVEEQYRLKIFPKEKSLLEQLLEGELVSQGKTLSLDESAVLAAIRTFAEPKVWAKMPDVWIR